MERQDSGPVSTLSDYLQALQRRKWIILVSALAAPTAAVVFSLQQPALYEASADVLLSRQNLAAELLNVNDPFAWDPGRGARTQAQLARVPEIARRALKAAGLPDQDPFLLLGSSSVTQKGETDLLQFSVRYSDRDLAPKLATEYAQAYTLYRQELDTRTIVEARRAVREEIDALRKGGVGSDSYLDSLLEKDQQLRTMETLQTGRAVLVRPSGGAGQIEPQPRRKGAIGLVFGLVLGIAIAFLREALDSRVRSSREVVERLELPLLGRIPSPRRKLATKNRLVMLSDPNGDQAESFRLIRESLALSNTDRPLKTVMITSAGANEGKSMTAANLALAMVERDMKVVLVDLDSRRPSLHKIFVLNDRPGVTDVLRGVAPLENAIAHIPSSYLAHALGDRGSFGGVELSGLKVVPSGAPTSPGDIGSLKAVGELLVKLSRRADLVIVDGPPLLLAADALSLTAQVDGLLVVCRLNAVRSEMLDDLHRVLKRSPAATLGVIITGAEHDKRTYPGPYAYEYFVRPTEAVIESASARRLTSGQ